MTYHVLHNDETKGPYTIGQLRSMWNAGTLTCDMFYCEGDSNKWLPLKLLADTLEPVAVSVQPHAQIILPPQRLWSPGAALVLSFFIPGLGQMYRGKIFAGFLWFVCAFLGYCFFVFPGLIIHLICMIDAYSGDPTLDGNAGPPLERQRPKSAAALEQERVEREARQQYNAILLEKTWGTFSATMNWLCVTMPRATWTRYNATVRRIVGDGNDLLFHFIRWLGVWLVIAVFVALIWPMRLLVASNSEHATLSTSQSVGDSVPASPANPTPKGRILYRVVHERSIPNGGYFREIVVDPVNRNERDLRLLGETLRYDTRNDRNATIIIFDDMKAASMSKDAANLEGEDGEFYDRHIIGNYIRNVNNGLHQLSIMLDGINKGDAIEVSY